MAYIHESPVRLHGRLKSSNVLVDNFWSCKVTDVDMPVFHRGEKVCDGDHARYYSKSTLCKNAHY